MTQRRRKLIGTIGMFVLVIFYALLALAVAVVLQVNNASKFVELVYYCVVLARPSYIGELLATSRKRCGTNDCQACKAANGAPDSKTFTKRLS